MYGNVVLEVSKHDFDTVFDGQKKKAKAKLDTELTAEDLQQVITGYKALVQKKDRQSIPQDAMEQLQGARDAVFRSWFNDRAKYYRKMNQISESLGTAVNVQAMVFGTWAKLRLRAWASHATRPLARRPSMASSWKCAGRRRGGRHPHAASDFRTQEVERSGLQPAARNHVDAGEALSRHPGFRIHHPGWQTLHAADSQRQADRAGGSADRRRDGGRRAHRQEGSGVAGGSAAARPATASGAGSEVQEDADPAGQGTAGFPGRVGGHDRIHCQRGGGEIQELAGYPGAQRDCAGRHSRHGSGQGHFDVARRHDQPRGGGLPRYG